ncbi:MAG: class I SAM-dependent methyltransferase [bacterium]|nr:class I SAM-dependent methyltransferase [bacterium]
MENLDYEQQHRGDRGAYARYLNGMDASMRQKVALTAAHILSRGRIADMGMGSGTGSEALAALYPALQVVGVDVNPEMVAIASERYRLPNLEFVTGDIAERVFEPESLDGILNSSVLHHVTTFNNYDYEQARRALTNQVAQLRPGGVLIVRDFLDPGPGQVYLDLPANDGSTPDDTATPDDPNDTSDTGDARVDGLSTAALFERFAGEFRKLASQPGFAYERVDQEDKQQDKQQDKEKDKEKKPGADSPRPGFLRYRLSYKHAVEFVLRKDYRRDWATEVLEEYTYFSQADFEQVFAELGLRVTASTPIRNPWIVRNRFREQFELRDLAGRRLEIPATNYLIAGEKVAANEGLRFVEGDARPARGFLHLEHYRDRRTQAVMDLVRRPGRTLDVIPYFLTDGDCFVLARKDYPRPLAAHLTRTLDGRALSGYVSEPLAVIQGDGPIGRTVEEALARFGGIAADSILEFRRGSTYYPSPGGIEEEVRSTFVQTKPIFVESQLENRSGFSSAGQIRAIEARQLLRAAQVGGLPDARLELNVYHLLRMLGIKAGPWIGETIALAFSGLPPRRIHTLADLAAIPARRVFEKAPNDASASAGFLELRSAEFAELNQAGDAIKIQQREYVRPRPLSLFTITAAVLRRSGDTIYIGLDDHDLPAAQSFYGNSNILVTPAWRLPHAIDSITPGRAWVCDRLLSEYGVEAGEVWELGGPYMPSPGVTPELVYPIAIEARTDHSAGGQDDATRSLHWIDLKDFCDGFADLRDGHLRIAGLRAAHALGLL